MRTLASATFLTLISALGVPQAQTLKEANDLSDTTKREVTKLASGIYEIRHEDAPDGFPQGNTLVVIGARSVFVFDSCYWPATAQQDIDQIRKWTKKPVRFLANSHWHYDHTNGNAVYAAAFPGLQVIAHRETQKQEIGYNPGFFRRYPDRNVKLRGLIEKGVDESGAAFTDKTKADMLTEIKGREEVWPVFKRFHPVTPNRSFDTKLTIDLGGRKVDLMFLGRGNTLGDIVAFLPKERVVAAGDLLDHPVPYLGGGYPVDEVKTLENLKKLNAKITVPGHGAILYDSAKYIDTVHDFLLEVNHAVSETIFKFGNGTAHQVEELKEVGDRDWSKWRTRFTRGVKANEPWFDTFSLPGAIKASFYQQVGR